MYEVSQKRKTKITKNLCLQDFPFEIIPLKSNMLSHPSLLCPHVLLKGFSMALSFLESRFSLWTCHTRAISILTWPSSVLFFFLPRSRGSSRGLGFQMWMPSGRLWWWSYRESSQECMEAWQRRMEKCDILISWDSWFLIFRSYKL